MTKAMHPDVADLAERIDAASRLMCSCGELHWGVWLARDAAAIRNLDLRGVEHFLAAFGGMGSITDLVISPLNGHTVAPDQATLMTDELRALLFKAADLARRLHAEEVAITRSD